MINYFSLFVNIIMINFLKIFELLILGFIFPLTVVYFKLSQFILLFLWIISFYAVLTLLIFYRKEISFKKLFYVNIFKNKIYIYKIILRWMIFSFFLYVFTSFFFPEKLFGIQKQDINLLYKIFIFYPFFSAFPQEFIFCTFFFIRYKSLFKKEKTLVIISALVFCFAHIFSINWVAPLLSFFGGLIFASTFKKTKSLTLVSIEHSLYGNSLFAIGLGWFFWGGSVAG